MKVSELQQMAILKLSFYEKVISISYYLTLRVFLTAAVCGGLSRFLPPSLHSFMLLRSLACFPRKILWLRTRLYMSTDLRRHCVSLLVKE